MLARRLGKPTGDRWISVGRLPELRGVDLDTSTGDLAIGAATTLVDLASSPLARIHAPLLTAAAGAAASAGIRSIATIGGNLLDTPSASDPAAAAVALGASFVVRSAVGERLVPVRALPVSTLAVEANELVVSLRVPSGAGAGWSLQRLQTQGRGDRPALTVAVHVATGGGGPAGIRAAATFLADRLVDLGDLGGAVPADGRGPSTAALIADAALAATDRALQAGAVLLDDTRASAGYRRAVVGVLAARAVAEASGRRAA